MPDPDAATAEQKPTVAVVGLGTLPYFLFFSFFHS